MSNSAPQMDRSALHYAAALDDDQAIYKTLVTGGATSGHDKVHITPCDIAESQNSNTLSIIQRVH